MLKKYYPPLQKWLVKFITKSLEGKSFKGYSKKQDTYCKRCKTKTNDKLITAKQVVNKLISQKSSCVDSDSKNVFVKEYKPNKKKK